MINVFRKMWVKKTKSYLADAEKMENLADEGENFLQKSGLQSVVDDLSLLLQYVKGVAKGEYKQYSLRNLALAVAAVVYVVNPLDVIPDIAPIAGFVDDATIVVWAITQLHQELQAFKNWRKSGSADPEIADAEIEEK